MGISKKHGILPFQTPALEVSQLQWETCQQHAQRLDTQHSGHHAFCEHLWIVEVDCSCVTGISNTAIPAIPKKKRYCHQLLQVEENQVGWVNSHPNLKQSHQTGRPKSSCVIDLSRDRDRKRRKFKDHAGAVTFLHVSEWFTKTAMFTLHACWPHSLNNSAHSHCPGLALASICHIWGIKLIVSVVN